jgi:RecB family exonuclease
MSLFFVDGESEQIGDKNAFEMSSQPNRSFRESKIMEGVAATSIVLAQKSFENSLRSLDSNTLSSRPLPMDKENRATYFSMASAIQAEHKWKKSLKEAKRERVEEVSLMEAELQDVKERNLKEKAVIDELEVMLSKHKKRVEKQRKWSETQSQYRICLEKMIRDAVHQ